MIKIVLLCILIILGFLIYSKDINEGFTDDAKTVKYVDAKIDNPTFILNDDIKIYKTTIKRGTPTLDPETNQPTEMETEVKYSIKASDIKSEFPHAIKKDGQVELVNGDSLSALLFGICRENFKNINTLQTDIGNLKASVYALETNS